MSEEAREKIRQSRLGKKWTAEQRKLMGKRRAGKPAWNKGVEHSEETRRKISESMRGKKQDPEVVARRAAAQRGAKRPTRTCPHCGSTVAVNTYARWHGANCRSNGV